MKRHAILIVFLYMSLVGFAITPIHATPSTAITFGIVPQQSTMKLAKLWVPVLQYLSAKTGYQLLFKTANNIPAFERRLADGSYDVAYMNPYHYTVFHAAVGYTAFAKSKGDKIKGVIVVRRDSPYRRLSDLADQQLAFPSPSSFAASVLTRARLEEAGVSFIPAYVGSHDSVYQGVARGLYMAGGGIPRTLDNMTPSVRDQLRILETTPHYTSHAFAAHPRMPVEVVSRIQQAMEEMHRDPNGLAVLQMIRFEAIERARNSDWDDVRSLGIQLPQTLTQH